MPCSRMGLLIRQHECGFAWFLCFLELLLGIGGACRRFVGRRLTVHGTTVAAGQEEYAAEENRESEHGGILADPWHQALPQAPSHSLEP